MCYAKYSSQVIGLYMNQLLYVVRYIRNRFELLCELLPFSLLAVVKWVDNRDVHLLYEVMRQALVSLTVHFETLFCQLRYEQPVFKSTI